MARLNFRVVLQDINCGSIVQSESLDRAIQRVNSAMGDDPPRDVVRRSQDMIWPADIVPQVKAVEACRFGAMSWKMRLRIH